MTVAGGDGTWKLPSALLRLRGGTDIQFAAEQSAKEVNFPYNQLGIRPQTQERMSSFVEAEYICRFF
jgi:hypothetical protein